MAGIPRHQGRTEPKVGPSDLSDTSSDRPGAENTDTDAGGTGERVTVGRSPSGEKRSSQHNEAGVDRIVGPEEAGLGKGLDEAEKARLDPVKKPKR